ncbi:MAG: hypothetical protein ACK5XV_01160 [Flavobacteriales bacterium]|jgi:hypothetical protein
MHHFRPFLIVRTLIPVVLLSLLSGPVQAQRHRSALQGLWRTLPGDPAEEEEEEGDDPFRGFSIGLNIGSYFGSRRTANFYNGTCQAEVPQNPNEVSCFSIPERIELIEQNLEERNHLLQQFDNATDVEVPWDSSPLNMRYMPSFMVGMQIKYNFNRDNAIVFNVNSMRLKAADVFTLRFIGTPQQLNAQQDIRTFSISGTEQRFNFTLGYRMGAEINPMTNWYFQPGVSMLGTQFERNEIFIGDRTYDLFIGAANPQQILPYQPRTDIGFGGYASTGLEFFIKEKYSFDISLGFSRDKVILLSLEENVWNTWIQASFTL